MNMTKPSRSDEILGSAEQEQICSQVRAHFDSIAPKRTIKPDRSEPCSSDGSCYIPSASGCDVDRVSYLPHELEKLQSLQHQSSQAVFSHQGQANGSLLPLEQEEFVETQYYKTLVSMDKQHHTTGTGFIKVASGDEKISTGDEVIRNGYYIKYGERETMFKSNPATNDWVPSVEEDHYQVGRVSTKPHRSETS